MFMTINLDGSESLDKMQKLADGLVVAYGGKIRTESTVDIELSLPADLAAAYGKSAPITFTEAAEKVFAEAAIPTPLAPPLPPVAPTPAAAPPSISAPTAPLATSVELDIDGLPWDERIHSSNHKRNGKNQWWAKRNVSEQTLAAVTAELRQAVSGTAEASTLFTSGELAQADELAAAPLAPPLPPVPPTANTQADYVKFVAGVMALKLDFQQIGVGLAAIGVSPNNLPTLKTAADKDPTLLARAAAQFGVSL
jgi:hypothetical protein